MTSRKRKIRRLNGLLNFPMWLQRVLFNWRIRKVEVKPPLFILGHWRNGTTHLQYLLSKDTQWSCHDNFQSVLFNVALLTRGWLKPWIFKRFPTTRRMDNMAISPDKPGEEEVALGAFTHRSGVHSMFFPQNRIYFDQYLFPDELPEAEREAWKSDFHFVLQSITFYRDGQPLLLKNPFSTARAKILVEMYPKAKFIFIHRDPYEVFSSTQHLWQTMCRDQMLQEYSDKEIQDIVLYVFETSLKGYLAQKESIPEGNLVEIAYEELTHQPIETLEGVYLTLNLQGWEKVKPQFESYLDSLKGYQRNRFTELSKEEVEQINERWGFYFDAFGYKKR